MSDYLTEESRIKFLVQSIHNGIFPTIAAATRDCPHLYGRVKNRLAGRGSRSERPATNRLLTDNEEKAIVLWVSRLEELGTRPTTYMLENEANRLLAAGHLDPNTQPRTIGGKWAARFCDRNGIIVRSETPKEIDRVAAEDREIVQKWFDALKVDCEKYGILDSDKYNMDESGVRIGIGKKEKVLVLNVTARTEAARAGNREMASIIEAICADGHTIPPLILLKGVKHQMRWYTQTSIPGTWSIGVSKTAYTNDEIAMAWIKHFERWTAHRQVGTWRLLILDGHNSHCTPQFLEYAELHNIKITVFPSHLTHVIQPLDVVCFQPFKHYCGKAINNLYRHGADDICKVAFLDNLPQIRQDTYKVGTVKSAFEETGLVPYAPYKVLDKLPLPPTPPLSIALNERTPIWRHRPIDFEELKQLATWIVTEWPTEAAEPEFVQAMGIYMRYSMQHLMAYKMLDNHVKATAAHNKKRQQYKADARKSLQKNGVLQVSLGRALSTKKHLDEVYKDVHNGRKKAKTQHHNGSIDDVLRHQLFRDIDSS